jgi:hypothetical protein
MQYPSGPLDVGKGQPQLSGLLDASDRVVCGERQGVQLPITSLDAANVPLGHGLQIGAKTEAMEGSASAKYPMGHKVHPSNCPKDHSSVQPSLHFTILLTWSYIALGGTGAQ